jgi:hypothetical protein
VQTTQHSGVTKLESRLNYLVGITLMTNLYYVSGLFFLPSTLIILVVFAITSYYFFKRWNIKKLLFYSNFWILSGFVIFSLFFYIPEYVFRGSSFNPNDMLRVTIYLFFIGWTLSIRDSWKSIARFFGLTAFAALLLLMIIGFFEKYFPMLFALILPPNLVRGNLTRIGGTLIDPNTYSTALVVYFSVAYAYYDFVFIKGKSLMLALVFIPIFILIETAGSRQGILLFVIWLFSLGIKHNWKLALRTFVAGITVLFMFFMIFKEPLKDYAISNPNTSVARILFPTENKMSSLSDLERKASLEAGLNFIKNNFVVFGSGSFGFQSAYDESTAFSGVAFPHNGPIYLWTQYGILTLYFFYFIFITSKRALKSRTLLFFLFYLVQFFLLPNSSYYFLPVFLILCVDANYYYQVFEKQTFTPLEE